MWGREETKERAKEKINEAKTVTKRNYKIYKIYIYKGPPLIYIYISRRGSGDLRQYKQEGENDGVIVNLEYFSPV